MLYYAEDVVMALARHYTAQITEAKKNGGATELGEVAGNLIDLLTDAIVCDC